MQIKFWGVRGSIPCPGPKTVKYGGNTACLELRIKSSDRLIIIDAGSGIRELGGYMMAHDLPKGPIQTDILLTHTHWDHIMGFPFFTPIYLPTSRLTVYGPVSFEEDTLESIVAGQLTYRYFPVRYTQLASQIKYVDLKEGEYDFGEGLKVTTKYLNHPILCLGYRFEYQDRVLCTVYDNEPFQNLFCTDPEDPSYDEAMAQEGEQVALEENQRIIDFYKGADLLIHDAQYTLAEYQAGKTGWGHSTMAEVVAAGREAGVKRLALYHHDPERTDAQLDELTQLYCSPEQTGDMEAFFAREGMQIDLDD